MNPTDDTDITKQYQEILDRYARELAQNPPAEPQQSSPGEPASPLSESVPKPSLPPPPPEPADEELPPPSPSDAETALPSSIPDNDPYDSPVITENTTSPQAETFSPLPPQPTTITPPIISSPPPETHSSYEMPIPSRHGGFFKYLFYITLIIFLGVCGTIVYTVFFSGQKFTNPFKPSPTSVPVSTVSDQVCRLNDRNYAVGESFAAADGCNTCTCNQDLTIDCTDQPCKNSGLIPAVSQEPLTVSDCLALTKEQAVTIKIGPETTAPSPGCAKINFDQSLIVVNDSTAPVIIDAVNPSVTVQPDTVYEFPDVVGNIFAVGVHQIAGAEIWLTDK